MRYPQAYLIVDSGFQLPSVSVLQTWSLAKAPIYVAGKTKSVKSLDERICALKDLHEYLGGRNNSLDNVIVINSKSLGYFLLMAIGTYLKKVFWVDNAEQARKLVEIKSAVCDAQNFTKYLSYAAGSYSTVVDFINENSSDQFFRDDQIESFFEARLWGSRSTAEHHLKRIAKNETRAGILQRLDL